MNADKGAWVIVNKLNVYAAWRQNGRTTCVQVTNKFDDYAQSEAGLYEASYLYLLEDGTWRRECEMKRTDIRVIFQEYRPLNKDSLQNNWELIPTPAEELTNLLLGNPNNPKEETDD